MNNSQRKTCQTIAARLLSCVLACILVASFTGCGSVSTYKVQYLGVSQANKTDPARIQILHSYPDRPYERLGEVVANVSVDPEPPVAKIEQAIKGRAAELGADAVVLVKDKIESVGMWWGGPRWAPVATPIYSRVIVAVAIRFTN